MQKFEFLRQPLLVEKSGPRKRERKKFLLVPMGVLAPGSAHARPSARPPIDTSGNFSAHMSGGVNCLTVFLAKSENSKHFSFFSNKTLKILGGGKILKIFL